MPMLLNIYWIPASEAMRKLSLLESTLHNANFIDFQNSWQFGLH